LEDHSELTFIPFHQLSNALPETVTRKRKSGPNQRINIIVVKEEMTGKYGLPHPVPAPVQVVIEFFPAQRYWITLFRKHLRNKKRLQLLLHFDSMSVESLAMQK
jgi:hypothetical protein